MATQKPQTISYPAPEARPRRHHTDPLDPHVIVLFGATGDLAKRKLIPGLAYLDQSELAPDIQIVATSLEDLSNDEFRELAKNAIDSFGTHKLTPDQWRNFADIITYIPQSAGSDALAAAVAEAEAKLGPNVRRLHYLSVPPKAARAVITMLRDAKLVERSRVVMEKPFGTDLASAVALNDFVHQTFEESQIFRIDHFLGKEAAQNILAFRFANGLFEPIWNRNFIDHIQIDIPEALGLDQRASFYEETGAYKDMVVTHLFQVMAFVVMEPPTALEPFAISEEKNKVFRSMLPVKPSNVVRGQYIGYREEDGVAKDSDTETFIALKVGIDNWRWAGVPVYLRTGKRMAEGIRHHLDRVQGGTADHVPARVGGGHAGARPPDVRSCGQFAGVAVVLRQAARPRHETGQAVHAILHPGDRNRGGRAGGLRTAHPGRDARRPHPVHHRRRHRITVGAFRRAAQRPATGQAVPAGDVGPQRNSPVDRAQRVAAAVRARVARSPDPTPEWAAEKCCGSAQFGAEITDGLAEFPEDFVVGQLEAVVGVHPLGGQAGDAPAGGLQVVAGRAALAEPDQFGHVDVQSVLAPGAAHRPGAFVGEHPHVGDVLGGQPAARRAERGDVVQQPVLGVRRQVGQQPLGDPGGTGAAVKAVVAQRCWPVIAQIDGDGAALGGRLRAQPGQGVGLEGDDLGLVDLEHHGARRPGQPVGPRVEPGGQDDGLANAGSGRGAEEIVEKPRPHRDLLAPLLQRHRHVVGVERDLAVQHPDEEGMPDRAHQRFGEPVVEQRVRTARGQRPGGRDHGRGRPHAGGQIPAVALGTCRTGR
ncbi:hypothetical protein MAP_1687 [Mycobacterium avium subsp. paratuberculosis K-10]|uniref:Glucose-6-phosphate dehydrogenase (NADP(+)) n=1 Tax=Mycolicibacterium paratuberculosis (strain ATCC BAA-968 / K-10) TaxID=262316 RepID=Q73ZB6_MYCPA|nr:hypothetical protein MAP_1687 [Mycobacterium avium subsp. paratuberculosis K-10]